LFTHKPAKFWSLRIKTQNSAVFECYENPAVSGTHPVVDRSLPEIKFRLNRTISGINCPEKALSLWFCSILRSRNKKEADGESVKEMEITD